MKQLFVLTKNVNTTFMKRLIEEVGNCLCVNPETEAHLLKSDSFYLVRTFGVYRDDSDLDSLEKLSGAVVVNTVWALRLFRSKDQQYQFFYNHQIPILPWLSLEHSSWEQVKEWISLHPSLKYLVKPDRGQAGWGIFALDLDNLKRWWDQQRSIDDLSYVLQPFIEGKDELRVFFIKNQGMWTLKRKPEERVAANFGSGGSAEVVELPVELTSLVEKIIEVSGVFYGAIDLFWDGARPVVLELNTVPGIEQLENLTGENIINRLVHGFSSLTP